MSTLPVLSTGAVQQYPYTCGIAGRTRAFRLADGSEQRYLESAQRKSWSIRLTLLQESERAAFLDFAKSAIQTQSIFAFTDPADGTVYPTCRIAIAPIGDRIDGLARAALEFMISEVTT
jgi:hypothetical protein